MIFRCPSDQPSVRRPTKTKFKKLLHLQIQWFQTSCSQNKLLTIRANLRTNNEWLPRPPWPPWPTASSQQAFGGRMDKHAVHDVVRNLPWRGAVHDLVQHASIHSGLLRTGASPSETWHMNNKRLVNKYLLSNIEVSQNRGTPESSVWDGFSIINQPFWGSPVDGNPYISLT